MLTHLLKRTFLFKLGVNKRPIGRQGWLLPSYESSITTIQEIRKQTKGLTPASIEYRKAVSIALDIGSKVVDKQRVKFTQKSVANIYLCVSADSIPSFEVYHLFKYFRIPVKAVEINKHNSKIYNVSEKNMADFPKMIVSSTITEIPMKVEVGKRDILNYMIKNKLFDDIRTYSAYELHGVEFINSQVIPAIEGDPNFTPSNSTFNYLIYPIIFTKHFNFTCIFSYRNKVAKVITHAWKDYKWQRTAIKYDLNEKINEWNTMLSGNKYHGGDIPDESDFLLFAALNRAYNVNQIRKILSKSSIYSWYTRMLDLFPYLKGYDQEIVKIE